MVGLDGAAFEIAPCHIVESQTCDQLRVLSNMPDRTNQINIWAESWFECSYDEVPFEQSELVYDISVTAPKMMSIEIQAIQAIGEECPDRLWYAELVFKQDASSDTEVSEDACTNAQW